MASASRQLDAIAQLLGASHVQPLQGGDAFHLGIREAHRRQYRPIGSVLPHAPASKATAVDRLPELQEMWDKSPNGRRSKAALTSRVSINNPNTGVSPGDPVRLTPSQVGRPSSA